MILLLFLFLLTTSSGALPSFREAPAFRNGPGCLDEETIHVAMTLDHAYLRGSLAGVHSVLHHATCPTNIRFHFLSTRPSQVRPSLLSAFPSLSFSIRPFDPSSVRPLISLSLRRALDQPLNYARIYLASLIPADVSRIIYLDSDVILVDDIARLWSISFSSRNSGVLAAPEYCHANFSNYFTPSFWNHPLHPLTFENRSRMPCYFNTGVMVIDLERWREGNYTRKLEMWMEVQKKEARIYELGSLPPFLLVFAGEIGRVEHRWNQHGLGGDNVKGLCRDLHPGPVSLLHWSGKGKPWLRLDAGRPCPVDELWKPYDLLRRGEKENWSHDF